MADESPRHLRRVVLVRHSTRHRVANPDGCPPWKPTEDCDHPVGHIGLFDQLNHNLQDITTTETERTQLRKQLFQARDHIKKQRKDAHFGKVLKNLRAGGWGKRAMQPQLLGMTSLTTETGPVTEKQEIA